MNNQYFEHNNYSLTLKNYKNARM